MRTALIIGWTLCIVLLAFSLGVVYGYQIAREEQEGTHRD